MDEHNWDAVAWPMLIHPNGAELGGNVVHGIGLRSQRTR